MKEKVIFTAVAALLSGVSSSLAGDLPVRPEFARYEPMMKRSPFAVATAAAPPPVVSDFAKDLYVANAAHSANGDLVTVASSVDKNLKLYLTTAEPYEGYSISNIEWSDRVGETKVTISKDGQFATIKFNQALLSSPVASNTGIIQAQPQQVIPQPGVAAAGTGFGMIKPAPIPTLPTPPARVRPVIERNPQPPPPAPVPDDDNASE